MRERAGANPKKVLGAVRDAASTPAGAGRLDAGNLGVPGYNMASEGAPGKGGDPLDMAQGPPQWGDVAQRSMGPDGHRPPAPDPFGHLPPPPTNATGSAGGLNPTRSRAKQAVGNFVAGQMGWGAGSQGSTGGQAGAPATQTGGGSGGSGGGGGPMNAGNLGGSPFGGGGNQNPAYARAMPTLSAASQMGGKGGAVAVGAMIGADVLKFGFTGDKDARGRLGLPPAREPRMADWDRRLSSEGRALTYGAGTDVAPRHNIDTSNINAYAGQRTSSIQHQSPDYMNDRARDVNIVGGMPAQSPQFANQPMMPQAGAGQAQRDNTDLGNRQRVNGGNPWFDPHQSATNGMSLNGPQPIRAPQTP